MPRAALFLLALLAVAAGPLPSRGADEADPAPARSDGWRAAVKRGVRLAEELADYPVRHDVFHRCGRLLGTVRGSLLAAEGAGTGEGVGPTALREDLDREAKELSGAQAQVRSVVAEFGKGLELSYEGAFSDFSSRAEELASLMGRLEEEARSRAARLPPAR